jgi:hypothetical protein
MKSLKAWLAKRFPDEYSTRAERRSLPGLEALHWSGSHLCKHNIKDISSTGIYLVTDERWPQGTLSPLILACSDVSEPTVFPERPYLAAKPTDHQILVQTKAVRWGSDGIGLTFVLPKCMELWLWKKEDQVEAAEILKEFRIAQALAFLHRICPSAEQELKLLFREGLSNIRTVAAVEISLAAEKMLSELRDFDGMMAAHQVVMRVIECGSWAEDELTKRFWAGILATSCRSVETDESNLVFIDLLSEFATIDTRLFNAICRRAKKVASNAGVVTALPVTLTSKEMIEITGAHDLIKIDRNLFQMCLLGLLEERAKGKFFQFSEDATVTPTSLGLEMYARCNGHRGSIKEFYA